MPDKQYKSKECVKWGRRPNAMVAFALLLLWGITYSFSYSHTAPPPGNKKRILLEHSDSLHYNAIEKPGLQQLRGNVKVRHESWVMYCDSAFLEDATNSFFAYDNIRILEGDSLTITGGQLDYYGQDRMAELRYDVEMSNLTATLYTDSLSYDRNLGTGYYTQGGTIVDSLNTLTSIYGEYTPSTNEAIFTDEVVLENPDFVLTTDYLRYNTKTKIAYFTGPTTIVSDSGRIESTRGVYDTEKDVGILLDRSTVFNRRGTITADSIFYDKPLSFTECFGSMVLNDTINKANLYGEYGFFNDSTEYAFSTYHAWLKDYSKKDTLYLAADTMEMISYRDSIQSKKPVRLMRGYHNAKLFRQDLQGKADSVSYFSMDSILTLFQAPIVWNDSTQLEGDTIRAYFAADTLHHTKAWLNAKSMRQLLDPDKFEQIKGDSLLAFFVDRSVKELRAYGEVEMIYFPLQESIKHYFGVGHVKSPYVVAYFAADTIQRAVWLGPAEGTLTPIEQATESDKSLTGLTWKPKMRPLSPQDIFTIKRDSMGQEVAFTPPSLSDLSHFNGAQQALSAYEIIAQEVGASRIRATWKPEEVDTVRQEEMARALLPLYIRRPLPEDEPFTWLLYPDLRLFNSNENESWHYYTDQENQSDPIIPPYRMTLESRPLTNDESASEGR